MPVRTPIPQETLETLRAIPTGMLVDSIVAKGWPNAYIEGARPLQPGQRMAGQAVTLRFVPNRPDLSSDKPKGEESPEYVAMSLCGPGDVLVADAMGCGHLAVGGEIKFLALKHRRAGGVVTDGAVRDGEALKDYGFPIYCATTTARQGAREMQPCEVNGEIQCGGVLVRPGDAIVGDDDGSVVVPRGIVEEVVAMALRHKEVEELVQAQIEAERCSPGRYYPFTELAWKLYEEKTGKKRP